jgi:fermentation-respiration switch protein FrsA (DUF1100 family)
MSRFLVLLFVFSFVGLAWAWLRWFERANLYHPEKELTYLPSHLRLAFEDVNFQAPDGTALHGWYLPAESAELTLLFCHGNAGNLSHRVEKLRRLSSLGVNIFIFDYAGYGQSAGRPSEKATYRDVQAAYAYLIGQRRTRPDQIVLYGESLGSAVAVDLAVIKPVRAVILESPFTSTIAMGELLLPWLPVRAIVRHRYDTLSKIARVNVPLLILHSRDDEIVPFTMARQLYEAATAEKDFLELQGGHNDGFEISGATYTEKIAQFLKNSSK